MYKPRRDYYAAVLMGISTRFARLSVSHELRACDSRSKKNNLKNLFESFTPMFFSFLLNVPRQAYAYASFELKKSTVTVGFGLR